MGFRVAILGGGTVGGGVARILLEQNEALRQRSGQALELVRIVDLLSHFPGLFGFSHCR